MSRPLGSTATPSEQRLHGYYGPVRQRAPRRYSVPPVSAVGTLPLATHSQPGRRIDTRLLTFRARAADQAHAASTPDITWPEPGTPARLIPEEGAGPPVSMPPLTFDASTTTPAPSMSPDQTLLERLPGPHLTRSSRAFSPDAHHDGLQPTQHQGGLTPAPEGRRRRATKPPSLAQHHFLELSPT